MKKLSLRNASNMLSRKEMKNISGGYGGYGGSDIYCVYVYKEICEQKGFCSESQSLNESWKNAWLSLGWSEQNRCYSY